MLSFKEIRNDLKEIRYYYQMKDVFDRAEKVVKANAVLDMVSKYNQAMQNAPARLYVLYVSLYLDNNSQTVIADDWNVTRDYINEIHDKLLGYLQGALKI